jgi:hypothetical protein
MDRENRKNRAYAVTNLPTLQHERDITQHRDVLLKLYDQSCQTWRQFVDVRFKLLALVPTVSVLILAALLSAEGPGKGLSNGVKLFIAVIGFSVTIGLWIYDKRNSALHDDCISRARKIEDELGVDTGVFRGRLKPEWPFQHDVATAVIYGACIVAWLGAIAHLALCIFSKCYL